MARTQAALKAASTPEDAVLFEWIFELYCQLLSGSHEGLGSVFQSLGPGTGLHCELNRLSLADFGLNRVVAHMPNPKCMPLDSVLAGQSSTRRGGWVRDHSSSCFRTSIRMSGLSSKWI